MGRINWGRVFLGGIVAGFIINISAVPRKSEQSTVTA